MNFSCACCSCGRSCIGVNIGDKASSSGSSRVAISLFNRFNFPFYHNHLVDGRVLTTWTCLFHPMPVCLPAFTLMMAKDNDESIVCSRWWCASIHHCCHLTDATHLWVFVSDYDQWQWPCCLSACLLSTWSPWAAVFGDDTVVHLYVVPPLPLQQPPLQLL